MPSIYSLKRLQVIDLITNGGIFRKLNFSIPTSDFLDVINQFHKEFQHGFYAMTFFWIEEEQQYVSEILTPWGLCFSTNIAFSHDLLDFNITSSDFHYLNTIREINLKNWWHSSPPANLPLNISTSYAGLWVGFSRHMVVDRKISGYNFNGFVTAFHNSFELPSRHSIILNFNPRLQTKVLINPQMNTIDESLIGYQPVE